MEKAVSSCIHTLGIYSIVITIHWAYNCTSQSKLVQKSVIQFDTTKTTAILNRQEVVEQSLVCVLTRSLPKIRPGNSLRLLTLLCACISMSTIGQMLTKYIQKPPVVFTKKETSFHQRELHV